MSNSYLYIAAVHYYHQDSASSAAHVDIFGVWIYSYEVHMT